MLALKKDINQNTFDLNIDPLSIIIEMVSLNLIKFSRIREIYESIIDAEHGRTRAVAFDYVVKLEELIILIKSRGKFAETKKLASLEAILDAEVDQFDVF